jgi:hypothetical protein
LVRNSTNTVSLVVQSTTLQVLITSGILPNGTHRFAASYANNAFSLYIDGTLIGTATSGTVPACSVIEVGNENNANFFGDSIAQAALFPTRLTTAQLVDLTGGRIYYNPVEAYYAYYLTPEIPSAVITSVNSFF